MDMGSMLHHITHGYELAMMAKSAVYYKNCA